MGNYLPLRHWFFWLGVDEYNTFLITSRMVMNEKKPAKSVTEITYLCLPRKYAKYLLEWVLSLVVFCMIWFLVLLFAFLVLGWWAGLRRRPLPWQWDAVILPLLVLVAGWFAFISPLGFSIWTSRSVRIEAFRIPNDTSKEARVCRHGSTHVLGI